MSREGATEARYEGAPKGLGKGLISTIGLYCTYNTNYTYTRTYNRHRQQHPHQNSRSSFGIGCSSLDSLSNRNGAFGGSCAGRRGSAGASRGGRWMA